jgi:prophage antirepressor-like protein
MMAGGEISALILNIEAKQEAAETAHKWIYIEILKEIRKTRDIVTSNDLTVLEMVKKLNETYLTIQSY